MTIIEVTKLLYVIGYVIIISKAIYSVCIHWKIEPIYCQTSIDICYLVI